MVKITKPTEGINTKLPVHIVVIGYPSAGKSTLACSASRPLQLDLERGRDRMDVQHLVDAITLDDINSDFKELKDFLADPENLEDYDTIVFDTGKGLQDIIVPYLKTLNTAYVQSDGTPTIKGYTPLFKLYSDLINDLMYKLHKDVITVVHIDEKDKNGQTVARPALDGRMKQDIFKTATLACLLETKKDGRTLSFDNTEFFTGKRNHGVEREYVLPDVSAGTGKPNDFFAKFIKKYKESLEKDNEERLVILKKYKALMDEYRPLINKATVETFNDVSAKLITVEHISTSKVELRNLLSAKAESLGLAYNKESGLWEKK